MAELLSCPFCGGEAEFVEGADDDGRWVAIGCPDCGAGSRQHYAVMEDPHPHAQSAWNARASTQPAPAFPREDWGTLVHAVSSLRAAISLLEGGGKKAAPSDKMFAQMLRDYHKAADAAAKALATSPTPNDDLRAAGVDAALSVIDTFIQASSLESVRLVAQQVRNTVSAALQPTRPGKEQ